MKRAISLLRSPSSNGPSQRHKMSGARKELGPGYSKLAQLLSNYATMRRDEGKYEAAESLYKRSLDSWAHSTYPEHPDVAETLTNYSALLNKLNRPAEALEGRAVAIRTRMNAPGAID